MKKITALLMAVLMLLAFAACGKKDDKPSGGDSDEGDRLTALNILEEIWNKYPDDDRFPSFGGDYNADNQVQNAPSIHEIGDGTEIDNSIGYPAGLIDKIEDAAALRHMMNVNTFTCGAYYVKDSADVDAVCTGIRDNLMGRSYMCGWPETLYIIKVYDNYIVSVFGNSELISTFSDAATQAFGEENINVAYNESMENAGGQGGLAIPGIG